MDNSGLSGDQVYTESLTWREQDILILLAERLTNREIAERLHLAESTIKDYVGNILSKLYVKNRRQAVQKALELGLLERDRPTSSGSRSNLPPERTQFVGRRHELAEIKRQPSETRLLSLIGPGGIGKTRLALKGAEAASADFKDGIFFVPLAPIRSSKDIIQTIAEALKFPIATHEDPGHQLLRYLRSRNLLLVMDNFEHLLDGVEIVTEILQAAPQVKILATSRERLNLGAETILAVGGLGFPAGDDTHDISTYDAITLFLQSANKVRPGFDPSPDELAQIGDICQIVGGLPLAIELAAAWLHILNVAEIAAELEKDLDILSTEVRDAPERHRSIRTVFDQSWSLLDPAEREIFTLLSIFRGGFTRDAAGQVAGASLKLLSGLVNKSFIHHDPDSDRLGIHELLRQYAEQRLEGSPETHIAAGDAHAAFYADFMQQHWDDLKSSRQMLALAEIEADIQNIRAAWRHYLDQKNTQQLWKLIYGIWHVYWIHWWNHAGMQLFAEAAQILGHDDPESAALSALSTAFQGYFMAFLDLSKQGYEKAQEGVAILEQLNHPKALAFANHSMVLNAYFLSRYTDQIDGMNKMVAIARELDDQWLTAFALFGLSLAAIVQEDYQKARELANTHLEICQQLGDRINSTTPLIVLGHAALGCGELDLARDYYLRCLNIAQESGFHYAIQTSTKYLSNVAISLGNLVDAEKYLCQSLRITNEIGFVRDVVILIYEYARLQVEQDNFERAVELLALVIQHPTSNQYRMLQGHVRDSAKELLATLASELPPHIITAAQERGRQMDLDDFVT
ncbi:MAG: LuxR C-terminal-related transcriptional regulator, partial [Chloroflexota bacterium]